MTVEMLCYIVLGKLWRRRVQKLEAQRRYAKRNPDKIVANNKKQAAAVRARKQVIVLKPFSKQLNSNEPWPFIPLIYFIFSGKRKTHWNTRRYTPDQKARKSAYHLQWQRDNRDRVRSHSEKCYYKDVVRSRMLAALRAAKPEAKAHRKEYIRNNPGLKKWHTAHVLTQIAELEDGYIAKLIVKRLTRRGYVCHIADIPKALIEGEREVLHANRELAKTLGHGVGGAPGPDDGRTHANKQLHKTVGGCAGRIESASHDRPGRSPPASRAGQSRRQNKRDDLQRYAATPSSRSDAYSG